MSSIQTAKVKLYNGVEMPIFGLGVHRAKAGEEVETAVKCALQAGYRSIDTATYYQNEQSVGKVILESGIPREKIFLTSKGWDMTFATNHLGAFELTELLASHLPDGANVVFIASAIEDPERKPAKVMGMRGGRYISVEASARGEWKEGGSKIAGSDAYATSKQCILASTMAFARENPRLHFNAVEPGITRGTSLGSESMNAIVHFIFGQIMAVIPPFSTYSSTPAKSAKTITKVLIDQSGKTGIYYDEKGQPMLGSELSQDPKFQDLVVAETRAFLSKVKV